MGDVSGAGRKAALQSGGAGGMARRHGHQRRRRAKRINRFYLSSAKPRNGGSRRGISAGAGALYLAAPVVEGEDDRRYQSWRKWRISSLARCALARRSRQALK
jgi:hypothetical protein